MTIKDYLKIPFRWMFRTNTSYSQTGEDLIAHFFLSEIKNGIYVDIGANDPIHLNNTYFFYKRGWRGLLVEPNSFRCGVLKGIRHRDLVLNAGVSGKEGSLDFYIFDLDNISTFSKFEADEFIKLGHKLIETRKVSTYSLEQIFEKYFFAKQVDVLSVDTEGLDLEILQSNNWSKYRPKVIIVETAEYRKDAAIRTHVVFNEYLANQGYVKIADTYINGIYMDKTYAELKKIQSII